MVYIKTNKGKLKKLKFKTNQLKFGWIGLKAISSGFLNKKHIEAAQQTITKKIKKQAKLWIRVFFNFPITTKSIGAWMGKGKGNVWYLSAWITAGQILFEISGINLNNNILALKAGSTKLPVKTKVFT